MNSNLAISLLGKLKITYLGEDMAARIPLKMQGLLYYLLLSKKAQTRGSLATMFWSDVPQKKGKRSLSVALTKLRQFLPDFLEITTDAISFNRGSNYWLDVEALEKALDEVNTAVFPQFQQAVNLYRGDLLSDFFVEGAPAFEEWLTSQRAYWRERLLAGMEQMVARFMAEHQYDGAQQMLQQYLTIEPWSEMAHAQLMLVYGRLNNFNAALTQYQTCANLLEAEFGVPPSPTTTALYERIQTARRSQTLPLPPQESPFIGRQREVVQIMAHLLQPDCRLLTILGIGGMGKTRLALTVAQRVNQADRRHFLNRVAFVSLVGSDAAGLPMLLARAVGLSLTGLGNVVTAVHDYLRDKEMLIIFDNFEHVLEGTHHLQNLLKNCPHVKLLVTSRVPLQLAQEKQFALEGVSVPSAAASLEPDAAMTHEAVQLFVQTARQVSPIYCLTASDTPHVVRLCQLVAGVPLALKLAATWLRAMPCEQIVTEVATNMDVLATRMHDVPARQRSMRAIFDHSWALLQEEEREITAVLSLFRGGFTRMAAIDVAGATSALLLKLLERGIIQWQAGQMGQRYEMHELMRQYAAEQLAAQPQRQEAARQRYLAYFLQLAEEGQKALAGSGHAVWFPILEAEHDNLRASLRYFVAQKQSEPALRFGIALADFWIWRGYLREGQQWLKEAFDDGAKQFGLAGLRGGKL